jgi:hypothetical protein
MAVVGVTEENINGSNVIQIVTTISTPLTNPTKFSRPIAPAASALVSSPGLNTFERQAATLIFPEDEDELFDVPSVMITKTSVETQFRISSSESSSSSSSSTSYEIRQRISRVPDYDTLSKFSGRMRAKYVTPPRVPSKEDTTLSSAKTPASNPPTPQPRPSTLKRKGMELLTEMGYAASNSWADDEEVVAPATPTTASRADRINTLRCKVSAGNKSSPSVKGLGLSPSTPSKSGDKGNFLDFLETLNLSPHQTIGKSVMRKYQRSLARSSPLRSMRNSPVKLTIGSPSKLGKVDEAVVEKKSIWDADDDEFENWLEQEI